MIQYFGYKRCSTSSKGEKFLKTNEIAYTFIDITISPPTTDDLKKIIELSAVRNMKDTILIY